ncbi:hypothetical protein GJ496_004866 [Pomphorhynchus laevis]|nr:hypothetical protein GJ496_004866 [Pomphorhynchus laevis]
MRKKKNFIKIPKGDYVILLQLVHEKLDILDQFKDFSINVLFKLSNGGVPAPDIYRSARSAIISKHKSSKFRLKYGKTEALYLGRVAEEKYPKGMTVGGCIRGNLLISATECTHKQTIVSLKYVVTDKSKKSCETTPITQTSSNTVDQYQTALRDFKVQWITKLTDETVISNILTESEDHLPAHLSNLERLCKLKDPDINTISVAFEKVKCLIDQNRLAKNLVSKTCTDKGDAGKIKSTLLEALCFMGKSLISKRPENWETLIDDLYRDTISWTEFDDNKVSCWTFEYFIAKGMVGKALSMIFAEKSNLQESRATELLRQMNWNYIADVHYANLWISMLTNIMKAFKNLAKSVAFLLKRMSTEALNPVMFKALAANRLVSINKESGVKPIGIGEVPPRIQTKRSLN